MQHHVVFAASIAICWALQGPPAFSQDKPAAIDGIAVKELGPLGYVSGGEHRLGAVDRMFLIEDQSDFYRYLQIVPKLPKIDFDSESILVVMSWKYRSRSLQFARQDGKQLVIGVKQELPPGMIADSYHSPKLLAFILPAWPGPVRFELNGKEDFTVLRGDALETRVDKLWDEILRIHSGGRQNREQHLRYYRKMWPTATEKELRAAVAKMRKKRSIDPGPFYNMLFRDLIDLRARSAIPRIFAFIDNMGKHDPAFNPAWKSVVAIGGSEIVTHCKEAFRSRNSMSRHAAILILRDLGLPETRELAYAHLVDPYMSIGRCSLDLLHLLGHDPRDVPELVRATRELEANMLSADGDGDISDILTLIQTLGYLGPKASAAIPELEAIASNPKSPKSTKLQAAAREALSKIHINSTE